MSVLSSDKANVFEESMKKDDDDDEELTWEQMKLSQKIDFVIDFPFDWVRKLTMPRKILSFYFFVYLLCLNSHFLTLTPS